MVSLLDTENIQIVKTMKRHGPRNLRNLSKEAGLNYPTVYARVNKLEREGVLKTWIHPNFSKIGLAKAMVLMTPQWGSELLMREALKIPGYWLRVTRCIGDCNGYYSLHAVPKSNKQDFEHFLDQVVARGLAANYKLFWLGETYSPIPNFDYYNVKDKTWKFDWNGWLKPTTSTKKPEANMPTGSVDENFDKKDLVILKELEKNARITLADLSKQLSLTLPATKYRFDRLLKDGFVHDYVINMLPYAPEMSDLLEVRLDFKNERAVGNYASRFVSLPFVLNYTSVLGGNAASLRIFLPHTEIGHFLAFLSSLIRSDVLTGYAYYLLDPMTIQVQTFSYKDYNDAGWSFENGKYLAALDRLASLGRRKEVELANLLPTASAPML